MTQLLGGRGQRLDAHRLVAAGPRPPAARLDRERAAAQPTRSRRALRGDGPAALQPEQVEKYVRTDSRRSPAAQASRGCASDYAKPLWFLLGTAGAGAAHRVRQPGQPPARPRQRARARDRGAPRPGRLARAARAPAHGREPAAGGGRRGARPARRQRAERGSWSRSSAPATHALFVDLTHRLARARLHQRAGRAHLPALRARAGVARPRTDPGGPQDGRRGVTADRERSACAACWWWRRWRSRSVLLAGALLFMRSLRNLTPVDRVSARRTSSCSAPTCAARASRGAADGDPRGALARCARRRAWPPPTGSHRPHQRQRAGTRLVVDGTSRRTILVRPRQPRLLRDHGTPLLAGRDFGAADDRRRPRRIVNQTSRGKLAATRTRRPTPRPGAAVAAGPPIRDRRRGARHQVPRPARGLPPIAHIPRRRTAEPDPPGARHPPVLPAAGAAALK